MKKKGILVVMLLVFWFVLITPLWASDADIELYVNGKEYTKVESELIGDRTFVPLRLVSEALGYKVDWYEAGRYVYIRTDGKPIVRDAQKVPYWTPITIEIDDQILKHTDFSGHPYISSKNRTMIPLRLVGEALNCKVDWVPGRIDVTGKPKPQPEEKPENSLHTRPYNPLFELTIAGDNILSAGDLNRFLDEKEPWVRSMMAKNHPDMEFTPFPEGIAEAYINIGKMYGIRGDLAFAQACLETGYFQFYGIVKPFQHNYCGLGATGAENTGREPLNGVDPTRAFIVPGLHGLSYLTVEDGVEAHIQHLYAYGTKKPLPYGRTLLDPRFSYVSRGIATRWIDLNGRWAVPGKNYGENIIMDYWPGSKK